MANRPTTTGGRTTKAERREQARREREELQRKIARSRRNRWVALAVAVLAVAAVAGFTLTRPSTEVADPAELLGRADEAVAAAGCDPVEDVGPYDPSTDDQAHVSTDQLPPLSSYPTVPPASGPHNAVTLPAGVYSSPPAIDRLLHSLEHGAAVVWYSPDASGAELDELRAFYREPDVGGRVIVAPYAYPDEGAAGSLPAGTTMALVAWHQEQTCAEVDLAAAFDFTARYAAPPFGEQQYLGSAPEAGSGI
ncbi:MAG: DUF3105 domain-containing protein [Actinomycetota bacterium]